MAPSETSKPATDLTVARILWGALFASTLLYIVVLELVSVESAGDWQGLLPIFAIGAAGAAGGSLLAPRLVSRSANAYTLGLILALAFAESVCILGLVLGFLGAPPKVVMPFFLVTWVLMALRFPTAAKMNAFNRSRA